MKYLFSFFIDAVFFASFALYLYGYPPFLGVVKAVGYLYWVLSLLAFLTLGAIASDSYRAEAPEQRPKAYEIYKQAPNVAVFVCMAYLEFYGFAIAVALTSIFFYSIREKGRRNE